MTAAIAFFFLLSINFCHAQFIVPVKTFRTPTDRPIQLVSFDPSGKIIGADSEGYLFIFDTKTGKLQKILRAHDEKINGLSFSQIGKSMATVGADSKVFFWTYPDGIEANKITLKTQSPFVAYAADGKSLFFSGANILYVMSATGENIREIYRSPDNITDGVISKDYRYIVFSSGGDVCLLDLNKKSLFSKAECCSGSAVTAIDFAKQNIASCHCEDGTTHIVDAISGKKMLSIPGDAGRRQSVLSSKGDLVATCNQGNDAQIWKITGQKMIGTLKGHTGAVKTAAFSPDDKYIATGSEDGTIRLWLIEDLQKASSAAIPLTEKLENRKVENQVTATTSTRTLEIFVWDDENVDGDSISLSCNGEWILRDYSLSKTRKKLVLVLEPGNNLLILYAHNLGKDPPNTAAISFMEGNKERTLRLNSDLNNCGAVNFIYKEE